MHEKIIFFAREIIFLHECFFCTKNFFLHECFSCTQNHFFARNIIFFTHLFFTHKGTFPVDGAILWKVLAILIEHSPLVKNSKELAAIGSLTLRKLAWNFCYFICILYYIKQIKTTPHIKVIKKYKIIHFEQRYFLQKNISLLK